MYHYVDNSMGAMEGQPPTTEYQQSLGQHVMPPQDATQHRWPSGSYGGYLNGGPMRWSYQYAQAQNQPQQPLPSPMQPYPMVPIQTGIAALQYGMGLRPQHQEQPHAQPHGAYGLGMRPWTTGPIETPTPPSRVGPMPWNAGGTPEPPMTFVRTPVQMGGGTLTPLAAQRRTVGTSMTSRRLRARGA